MIELPIITGLIAILYAIVLTFTILKTPPGEGRMVEIAEFIKEGASAYLRRQYTVIFIIAVA
ncbi:MAG: sodium/proton-translocating pyrophosphatase, partial [Sulfolobales archaeon]